MKSNFIKALLVVLVFLAGLTILSSCNSGGQERKVDTSGTAETLPEGDNTGEVEENAIAITIGNTTYTVELADNETAKAFKSLLPFKADMTELNGNEKYFDLPEALPETDEYTGEIHAGDLMLYGDKTLVLFYKDFETTYNYTPIGKIVDPTGIEDVVGTENVTVDFN